MQMQLHDSLMSPMSMIQPCTVERHANAADLPILMPRVSMLFLANKEIHAVMSLS